MEILFKRLKSNFELTCFYSDSPEGIKTQIWIVLIAHLLFSVIHRAAREADRGVPENGSSFKSTRCPYEIYWAKARV